MLEAMIFNPENAMFGCGAMALMAASMAMTAVAGVAQYAGQQRAAQAKTAYQNHLARLQQKAGDRKASAIIAQNLQAREATAKRAYNVSQEASAAAADAALSASASGVTGLSIGHLITNVERQESSLLYNLEHEQSLQNKELDRMLKDISLGTSQQMASTLSPVNYPSAFAAALSTGAQLADTGADMVKYRNKAIKADESVKNKSWFGNY